MLSSELSPDSVSVLVLVSVLATGLAALLRWRLGPAPRIRAAVLSVILLVLTGGAAVVPFVFRETPGAFEGVTRENKFLFSLLIFSPSIGVVGTMAVRGVRRAGDEYLHHANADLRRTYDYGKARALERGGNYDSAVAAYRDYYDANPSIPEPLFAAAQVLTHRGRFREAELILREVCERFEKNARVWPEAMYRLANLLDVDMRDSLAATAVFRELIWKAGSTEQARLAAERLLLRAPASNRNG